VTAPSDVKQAPTVNEGSSFKVVTAPSDVKQAPTVKAGSFTLTPPGDVKQAQAQPVVPHSDEPLPGEPLPGEPIDHEQTSNEVVGQVVLLSPGLLKEVNVDEPFSSIFTSDPQAVDVGTINNHSVVLKAAKEGHSDILFYNSKSQLIKRLEVTVDNYVYSRRLPSPDPDVISYSSLEIHNKALLTSQTNFRCGPDGCHYVGEVTVQEPAPLPRGYSNQSINSAAAVTTSEGTGAPQVGVPQVTVPATNRP
jgi:hypothetical protein